MSTQQQQQQRAEELANTVARAYGAFNVHPHYAAHLFADKHFKGLMPVWENAVEKPMSPLSRAFMHLIHREKAAGYIAQMDARANQDEGFSKRYIFGTGAASVIANSNGKYPRIRAVMAFASAAGVPDDAIRFSVFGGELLKAEQALQLPASDMLASLYVRNEHMEALRAHSRATLNQSPA